MDLVRHVLCVRSFYSQTGWKTQRMILSLRNGIILGPVYNEFGYYEHLATMINIFLQKGHFWLTSMFKNFSYNNEYLL